MSAVKILTIVISLTAIVALGLTIAGAFGFCLLAHDVG